MIIAIVWVVFESDKIGIKLADKFLRYKLEKVKHFSFSSELIWVLWGQMGRIGDTNMPLVLPIPRRQTSPRHFTRLPNLHKAKKLPNQTRLPILTSPSLLSQCFHQTNPNNLWWRIISPKITLFNITSVLVVDVLKEGKVLLCRNDSRY